jgi:hypothetical protein
MIVGPAILERRLFASPRHRRVYRGDIYRTLAERLILMRMAYIVWSKQGRWFIGETRFDELRRHDPEVFTYPTEEECR